MEKISIILVDDHSLVRLGLRTLLSEEPAFAVVGEAASGPEALALAQMVRPQIVVMDLTMSHLNGPEITRQITRTCPGTKVLVLSARTADEQLQQVLNAGACGYVLRQTAAVDLIPAITRLHRQGKFRATAHGKRARGKSSSTGKSFPKPPVFGLALSGLETKVLELIIRGLLIRQISKELRLSIKMVNRLRVSLMRKLRTHGIDDVVRLACTGSVPQFQASST